MILSYERETKSLSISVQFEEYRLFGVRLNNPVYINLAWAWRKMVRVDNRPALLPLETDSRDASPAHRQRGHLCLVVTDKTHFPKEKLRRSESVLPPGRKREFAMMRIYGEQTPVANQNRVFRFEFVAPVNTRGQCLPCQARRRARA